MSLPRKFKQFIVPTRKLLPAPSRADVAILKKLNLKFADDSSSEAVAHCFDHLEKPGGITCLKGGTWTMTLTPKEQICNYRENAVDNSGLLIDLWNFDGFENEIDADNLPDEDDDFAPQAFDILQEMVILDAMKNAGVKTSEAQKNKGLAKLVDACFRASASNLTLSFEFSVGNRAHTDGLSYRVGHGVGVRPIIFEAKKEVDNDAVAQALLYAIKVNCTAAADLKAPFDASAFTTTLIICDGITWKFCCVQLTSADWINLRDGIPLAQQATIQWVDLTWGTDPKHQRWIIHLICAAARHVKKAWN